MQAVQLKITLPIQLRDYLLSRAQKYGITMSSYIKNLILNDVKDLDVPTYQASQKTEQAYDQAKQEEKVDKLEKVTNLDSFFKNL